MDAQPTATAAGTIDVGGDLTVNRLGFGAMRITGPGIWGDPPSRDQAIATLRRVVELGVNFIDTADSYGPEVSETLIAEAFHPYPDDLVIATMGGLIRLLESAEDLVDPDKFNIDGVGLLVLILAEQHDHVFPRFCLSGDRDEQALAVAHPHRPGQQFRADDADITRLRAVGGDCELPAALVGPAGPDAQRGARVRRPGPGRGRGGRGGRAGRRRGGQPHRGACRHGHDGGSEGALQFPPGLINVGCHPRLPQ